MQQHRQVELARDLQLRLVDGVLPLDLRIGDEEVEPDLADGDEARVVHRRGDLPAQFDQVVIAGLRGAERVDAERVTAAGLPVRQRAHHIEVPARDRRHHDVADPRYPRLLDHRIAVGIEFAGIEVAVGVDPHGGARRAGALLTVPGADVRRADAGCDRSVRPGRYRA